MVLHHHHNKSTNLWNYQAEMFFIQLYLFLSIVMVLVVLWDFKTVPKTAGRFTKKVGEKETDFALIVLALRNMTLMALLAFFVWPAIIWIESVSDKEKL